MNTLSLVEPLALRIPAACHASGLGKTKLYDLAKEGKLKFVKVGGRTLVPMAELRRLIGEAV